MSKIDEIMAKVVESQDAAAAYEAGGCVTAEQIDALNDALRDLITAALADAERKGAEAIREAAAAMPDASASRLMQAKRVPMVDQHCAGILRDHADKIRALPLPTGSQS